MWLFNVQILTSPPPPDYPFYCPQNITGFYTIDFNTNPSFGVTNYCPLSTGNYYDFATTP